MFSQWPAVQPNWLSHSEIHFCAGRNGHWAEPQHMLVKPTDTPAPKTSSPSISQPVTMLFLMPCILNVTPPWTLWPAPAKWHSPGKTPPTSLGSLPLLALGFSPMTLNMNSFGHLRVGFQLGKQFCWSALIFLRNYAALPIFMKNLLGNIPSSLRCLLRTEKDQQGTRFCSPCLSISGWNAELSAVCTVITAVCRRNMYELLEALVNNCWVLPNDQTFQTINFTLIILRKPACLTIKSSIIMKIRKPKCLMLQNFLCTLWLILIIG